MSLIDVKQDRGVTVVDLLMKRLDASVAVPFKEALLEIVRAGNSRVVLDMSGVEFVDSSGLGSLVSILKAVGSQGVLAVCGLRPTVHSLFKLTRMDKVFALYATSPDAVLQMAS